MLHDKTTIYAEQIRPAQIPAEYELRPIIGRATFDEDWKAWSIYTRKEDDPVRIQLQQEIGEYNTVIEAIHSEPDFMQFFLQHGLAVTRQQITENFSAELADKIFTLRRYLFAQQIYTYEDWLFDPIGMPEYQLIPDGMFKESVLMIENPTDDERDVTYYLCEHFEKHGLLPENEDHEDGTEIDYGYNWFECYEQARESMERPDVRVLKAMELLKEAGYLAVCSVRPKEFHPAWSAGKKSDCSLDVYLLDQKYAEDGEVMEQLRTVLKSCGLFGAYSMKIETYTFLVPEMDGGIHAGTNDAESLEVYDADTGTGCQLCFNRTLAQAQDMARENGCTAFFFGTDALPSKAEYYRSEDGCKTYQLVRTSEELYELSDVEAFVQECDCGVSYLLDVDDFVEALMVFRGEV